MKLLYERNQSIAALSNPSHGQDDCTIGSSGYIWRQMIKNAECTAVCSYCGKYGEPVQVIHQSILHRDGSSQCYDKKFTKCCKLASYCNEVCRTKDLSREHWVICSGSGNKLASNAYYKYCKQVTASSNSILDFDQYILSTQFLARIINTSLQSVSTFQDSLKQQLSTHSFINTSTPSEMREYDIEVEESFSYLIAMLISHQVLPPSLSISIEEYTRVIYSIITIDIWNNIIHYIKRQCKQIYATSPQLLLLNRVTQLKTSQYKRNLSKYQNNLYYQKALDAKLFLGCCVDSSNGNKIRDIDALSDSEVDTLCWMIAQAASTANTTEEHQQTIHKNPFDNYGFIAYILLPPTITMIEERPIQGSCFPNIAFEAYTTSVNQSDDQHACVRYHATRDIYSNEILTINTVTTNTCDCTICQSKIKTIQALIQSLPYHEHYFNSLLENQSMEPYVNSPLSQISSQQMKHFLHGHYWLPYWNIINNVTNIRVNTSPDTTITDDYISMKLLADYFASEGKMLHATLLYSLLLIESIYAITSATTTNIITNSTTTSKFWSDVLLSLGTIGIEEILQHNIQPATSSHDQSKINTKKRKLQSTDTIDVIWNFEQLRHLYCNVSIFLAVQDDPRIQEIVKKYQAFYISTTPLAHCMDIESASYNTIDSTAGIYTTKENFIPRDECQWVIDTAEEYAKQTLPDVNKEPTDEKSENSDGEELDGWSTGRHYAVPTTDIPVHKIPSIQDWFRQLIHSTLKPLLCQQFFYSTDMSTSRKAFNSNRYELHIIDAFIVKYTGQQQQVRSTSVTNNNIDHMLFYQKQNSLPLHFDQSTHSLTIALNSADDYSGGGTYFAHLDKAVRAGAGQVLSFRGNILHGGFPVTKGTRYIIAAFLIITDTEKGILNEVTKDDNDVSNKIAELFSDEMNKRSKPNDDEGNVEHNDASDETTAGFSFSFF